MALEGIHLDVERILGRALEKHGFALGGGYALQAHGITDRPSQDLDNYSKSQDPATYDAAEHSLVAALEAEGFVVDVRTSDSWFRAFTVTAPSGERLAVDLGYDYRKKPPVYIDGIGPVLDIEDVVTGKVRAFTERSVARDYYDIDGLILSGRWSVNDLYRKASELRPDLVNDGTLTREKFADKMSQIQSIDREELMALGVDEAGIKAMQERLIRAGDVLTGRAAPAPPPQEDTHPDRPKRASLWSRLFRATAPNRPINLHPSAPPRHCSGRTKSGGRCILQAGHGGYHRSR